MLEGSHPVLQAFLGTLMTWGLTAAGAAMAFFIKGNQVSFTDTYFTSLRASNVFQGVIYIK